MTVVVAVKVPDGAVLGTDSATHLRSGTTLKSWSNAPKLFQVKDLAVGIVVHGLGSIGGRSVGGIIRDFSRAVSDPQPAMTEMASDLYAHVQALHAKAFRAAKPTPLNTAGFFIAGYDEASAYCEGYEFVLPRDAEPRPLWEGDSASGNALWRGVTGPLTRLLVGWDPRVPGRLANGGMSEADIERVADGLASPITLTAMPVKAAVNYVRYMLETTIGLAELEPGMAPVSRPFQIAAILPEGFRWLSRIELEWEKWR